MSNPIDYNFKPFTGSETVVNSDNEYTPNSNDLRKIKASPISTKTSLIEKIKEIASFVLTVAVGSFLFWVNPTIFALGFLAGIIFDDQVREAIQKIKSVWNRQKLANCIICTVAGALSLPVTLATASLLWSAHLGSMLSDKVKTVIHEEMPQVEAALI